MDSAQTWHIAPTQKSATPRRSDLRRPNQSPKGAAARAPRAVPALRMATIIEESLGQRLVLRPGSLQFVAN